VCVCVCVCVCVFFMLLFSCREIVSIIDRDSDGLVDKQELLAYLVRLGEHNDKQQSSKVMEKADRNKDGKVNMEEYWQYSEGERPARDD